LTEFGEKLGGGRVDGVADAVVGHERDPLGVDVELHRPHRARTVQQFGEGAHGQRRAHGVDDVSVRGDTDAGAPDEVAIVDGEAPEVVVGAVDGRDDLAVVDEKYEVLPHADNVGGHGDITAPLADRDGAVPLDDFRGLTVAQTCDRSAVEVETATSWDPPTAAGRSATSPPPFFGGST